MGIAARPKDLRYAFFTTKPEVINSIIDAQHKIKPEQWLVCFTCKKGTEHAMIYMEGMWPSGQRFVERYHITAEGIIGVAKVHEEPIDAHHFNRELYYFNAHLIDSIQGITLRREIRAEKGQPLSFSKFYASSSKGTVNCVKWAIAHLKDINVVIDASGIGLPSSIAKGVENQDSSCLIM